MKSIRTLPGTRTTRGKKFGPVDSVGHWECSKGMRKHNVIFFPYPYPSHRSSQTNPGPRRLFPSRSRQREGGNLFSFQLRQRWTFHTFPGAAQNPAALGVKGCHTWGACAMYSAVWACVLPCARSQHRPPSTSWLAKLRFGRWNLMKWNILRFLMSGQGNNKKPRHKEAPHRHPRRVPDEQRNKQSPKNCKGHYYWSAEKQTSRRGGQVHIFTATKKPFVLCASTEILHSVLEQSARLGGSLFAALLRLCVFHPTSVTGSSWRQAAPNLEQESFRTGK